MASKFRYEYSVREGKNETLLGTITCTLFGSDEPYDDAAGRVPIYQMKHSHDAKSGLTTVSGYAESDLDFFEPQLSWEGSTINSSSHQWPKNDKGESLCVSIYCDGEVKKPVVEYPILSSDYLGIDIEFADGKTRRPFRFEERAKTMKHFVAKDSLLAKSGQTVDDLSSIVITVGLCDLVETAEGSTHGGARSRAGAEWLGNSARYQHDHLSHIVGLGEEQPIMPQDKPFYDKRAQMRVKRVNPIVRFIFYYKGYDVLTQLGIIPSGDGGNASRDGDELPVLVAAGHLEKLGLVPEMYKGGDVRGFVEICRNAAKAVTLMATSLQDEDWTTFESLREKQASIEIFTKSWPTLSQLRTFFSLASNAKEAETAYRGLVILLDRLVALKNTPLTASQEAHCQYMGQFKLSGRGLQASTLESLKDSDTNGLLALKFSTEAISKRRALSSKETPAKKAKGAGNPSTRGAKPTSRTARSRPSTSSTGSRAQQSTSSHKVVNAASSSQRGPLAAARQEASPELPEYTPKSRQIQQGKATKQTTVQQAAIVTRTAQGLPTPAASASGSHVRNASPEDVKPFLRPVVDLTGDDERNTSIAVALSAALGNRELKPEVLDVFVQAGFEPDISLGEFKQELRKCNEKVKEEFYGKLKEVMPLLRFGIFLNRLEGLA